MKDLNVVIAGSAGEGVQTIGEVFTKTLAAYGYAAFTWKEYESRIRGGQNSFAVRVGETASNAPLYEADVLLALNGEALEKYRGRVREGGGRGGAGGS